MHHPTLGGKDGPSSADGRGSGGLPQGRPVQGVRPDPDRRAAVDQDRAAPAHPRRRRARVRQQDPGGCGLMSGRNATGEGSVYQRKDGRWVAAAYVPIADGTYKRVLHYVRTKSEAKAKLREMMDRARKNVPAPPPSLTVEEYLGEWLVHIKQHVRRSSWVAYEANTRLHIVPRIGRKKLS